MITQDKHREWITTVEIAGLEYRYSTGSPTSAVIPGRPGSPSYVDIKCVSNVSNFGDSLPLEGGVSEQQPIKLTVGRVRDNPGDPFSVFSIITDRGSTSRGDVTRTITAVQDVPFSIQVRGGAALLAETLPLPGVINIGQEQMWATEVDEETDELVITARGVGGTRIIHHEAREFDQTYPILTGPEVVFWRTRPAIVWVEPADRSSPPIQLMRGFLQKAPEPNKNNTAMTIEVVPLTALISDSSTFTVIGDRTQLVEGYHEFFHGTADRMEFASYNDDDLVYDVGRYLFLDPEEESEILVWPGVHDDADSFAGRLDDGFVPMVTDVLGDWQVPYYVPSVDEDGDGSFDPQSGFALRFDRVEGNPSPNDYRDTKTYTLGFAKDDITAGNRAYVDGTSSAVRNLSISSMWSADFGDVPRYLTDFDDTEDPPVVDESSAASNVLWFPFLWTDPQPDAARTPYGLQEKSSDTATWAWWATPPQGLIIRPYLIAKSFYQNREPSFLVEDPIDVSSGEVRIASIRRGRTIGNEDGRESPIVIRARVNDIEPVVIPVGPRLGDTVYRISLTFPERVPSFGEWPEGYGMESRVYINTTSESFFEDPNDALLALLTRSDGLGLSSDDVDLDSFRDHAQPPWLKPFQIPAGSFEIGAIIESILKMTRTAISMVTGEDGICRMTRVRVGAEIQSEVSYVLDQSNLAEGGSSFSNDNKITNKIVFNYDYKIDGEGDGDFELSVNYFARPEIAAQGGEIRETSIDVYGALNKDAEDFAQIASFMFDDLGKERRQWDVTTSTVAAFSCPPGTVVSITDPDLLGYSGRSAVNALARVVDRKIPLDREKATLTLVTTTYGSNRVGSGWNASMQITAAIGGGVYSVAEQEFSEGDRTDLSYFETGDQVYIAPPYDMDDGAVAELTIVDRDLNRFSLDPDPGASVGDIIVPGAYATASLLHRSLAYMDVGQVYV